MSVPPSVAAALLAWAAATDNRNPENESAALAWAEALDARVNIPDGKAAINAHRATSADWLMPSHVNAGVRAIRRARIDGMSTPQPPAELDGDPVREIAWGRAYVTAIANGSSEPVADLEACQVVYVTRSTAQALPAPVDRLVSQVAYTTRIPRRNT